MRNTVFAVFFLAICSLLAAQQALNNAEVIKLVKAGLSDGVIVATINAAPGTYDTSVDGLVALKQAGVSDKVIGAIVVKAAGGTAPVAAVTQASSALPAAVNDVGIYYQSNDGSWREVDAEVVNFKTGGVLKHLASVGMVKGDLNGHIGGAHSRLNLHTPAKFIFYVPEGRSPGEYQLLRLHVNSNNREFRSVTGGVFHETGGAIRDDIEFTPKKIAPRAYEIILGPEIGKGEFGFLPPLDLVSEKSLASSGKIYTFSILE